MSSLVFTRFQAGLYSNCKPTTIFYFPKMEPKGTKLFYPILLKIYFHSYLCRMKKKSTNCPELSDFKIYLPVELARIFGIAHITIYRAIDKNPEKFSLSLPGPISEKSGKPTDPTRKIIWDEKSKEAIAEIVGPVVFEQFCP